VKEGGSRNLHLDFHDYKLGWAWVWCVGDFEGGELCLPQLGVKIPLVPGQLIAFMAGSLAHFTAPFKGKRIVFTGFSDSLIMMH
jgi:hypothetical protein